MQTAMVQGVGVCKDGEREASRPQCERQWGGDSPAQDSGLYRVGSGSRWWQWKPLEAVEQRGNMIRGGAVSSPGNTPHPVHPEKEMLHRLCLI